MSHTKNELRSFKFSEDFVSVKKWSKFALKKMALKTSLNARISNTRAVIDLCLLYLTITPLYLTINLSMILL